jgi:putative glutamine amidotransferase
MKRPVIGITLDYEQVQTYSKYPWYALRDHYCSAISAHGGVPLGLPHEVDLAENYLQMLDGLVITGGAFDVPPDMYGDAQTHETTSTKPRRSAFEAAITHGALTRDMPILGICGGQQLLAALLGGTLIQHIPDSIKNPLEHEQPNPRNEVSHAVNIAADSKLHDILQTDNIMVNSAHHQAVKSVPDDVIINATAPDGVIEGIEMPDKRFVIGVQWHPEFLITKQDEALYAAFIAASNDYKKGKTA